MKNLLLLFGFLLFAASCHSKKALPAEIIQKTTDQSQRINKLAFGSCNKHHLDQPLWPEIAKQDPDVWIWLGDIIYGDTENMREMQSYYRAQKERKDYQKFITNGPDVIGIWDDHDYGENDAGKDYAYRAESRDLLFEFLDVPADHPQRQREGAYTSWDYGNGKEKVKVLLLDARYFRDRLKPNRSSKHRFKKNEEGDILGEEQWAWLESELKNSDAAIHVIACGIQMISAEHYFEKWSNFPLARKRLFDLLGNTDPAGLILLSGDRHAGELSKMKIDGIEEPVYELTSTGLTHFWDFEEDREPNEYRVGNRIGNYNYGIIDIDWKGQKPVVHLELRGLDDEVYFRERAF